MIDRIKDLLTGRHSRFHAICKANNLTLDYASNVGEIEILAEVFLQRTYADYFPFYQRATVVDIGAHYGYFSLFASHNLGKDASIFSFEPSRHNFKQLQQNLLAGNINNVSAFNNAIGGVSGNLSLYFGDNPNHSILQDYSLVGKKQLSEQVQVKTLEQQLTELNVEKVDFLKMDCEGAEYAILQHTPSHIFDRITTISMEFHDLKSKETTAQHLVSKLREQHFKIVKFEYGPTYMNNNYGRIIGTKL